MSKTILVAGGAGFYGSNLVSRLLKDGNRVIVVDNLSSGKLENIEEFKANKNFTFINHDILNELKISEPINEIYNLATPGSPNHYAKDPIRTLNICYCGLLNLLNLAKEKNAKLLQGSTCEVYGDPKENPIKETYWGNVNTMGVRSSYDEGKRISETLIYNYVIKYKIDAKIVRIFNTYGPNMSKDDGRAITNFCLQAIKNQDITIFGDGKQTRTFQYIDDLVEGMIRLMGADKEFYGPVNLGSTEEYSVKELADIIIRKVGGKCKFVNCDLPPDDPKQRKPDISLAKKIIGYEPKVKLEEGLDKTIEYFRKICGN